MNPIVQASKATATVEVKSSVGKKAGSNFSDYMEKKMATERRGKSNLLGMQKAKGAANSAAERKESAAASVQKEAPEEATTIAALLGQFVQDLQKAAGDQKQGVGEWSFPVPDPELLQKIAQDAGMNESQLTALLDKMKNQDGKVSLTDFLASFSRHFQSLQDQVPVTTPETDLPLLQSFLERLGVPVPEVSKISEAAVRGDNTLDLQKFLSELQAVTGDGITDITSLEAEELQNLLANAGVSQQLQRALLPERLPVVEGLVETGPPVTLTLSRLKEMLAQAIQEVKGNRLQADPVSFLTDLQEVLTKSGFETKGPSLNSAVQGTLVSVFEKLMESVDFSKVKVQQGNGQAAAALEKKLAQAEELVAAQNAEAAPLLEGETAAPILGMGRDAMGAKENKNGPVSGELFSENSTIFQSEGGVSAKTEAVSPAAVASQAARPFVHIPNLPSALQQQSFAQLSQGVLQGLRNQEHHLVLKLYPKELGEVKVEMTVRDNQVAVSFAMENSRVKEVLESNLEQFKENMEKQGFALGECMVSLNKDTDSNETWQQSQAASLIKGASQRRTSLADLPEDILYQRAQPKNSRENGVDLFA
ncbi:flagellar hook-length control protein FliK [Thiovibrio frasassiensis]|uniref:Flagellar hook-length control protein FliK n=1 Tax=Thiovibrio frasassiensis TaxID=2984131 RepID=A0A9X4MLI5_9BACT|nr:flagellar hook-length control protein FliK [Thiovibrio frasassiensis]MDG4477019.1 flagellar hook-length control protein FliK [Thiovibrio frasassiensis]